MLAAIISDRSLFSIFVLPNAVAIARKKMSSRAANTHQKQARICSQNSRGNSFSLKSGCSGERTRATMSTVSSAKKIDKHTKRAPRLRLEIKLEMTRSAIIAKPRTRDRSIDRASYSDRLFCTNLQKECFKVAQMSTINRVDSTPSPPAAVSEAPSPLLDLFWKA